jgi:transcription antitermination factor NusG
MPGVVTWQGRLNGRYAVVGLISTNLTADPLWQDLSACDNRAWHVLYVKSRQEKSLADDLSAMGIPHFLPLLCQTRYYGGRKARVELPMFPGYIFLRGTLDEAYRADRTKRVVRIISVTNQRQFDWELRNVHLALSNNAVLDPYPHLVKGVRVEVQSGPFRGLQGVVEDRSRPDRLILQVQILGAAHILEIDGSLLMPID